MYNENNDKGSGGILMDNLVYFVPEFFEIDFLDKIKRLDRISKKIGDKGIEVILVGDKIVEVSEEDIRVYKEYKIFGEAPKISGWEFVAKVEKVGKYNIINKMGDHEVSEKYLTVDMYCDHCKSNRRRNFVMVLVNEDGEYMQVGRSCLEDFTGHMKPEEVANYYMEFEDLLGGLKESDSSWGEIGDSYKRVAVTKLLAMSMDFIEEYGYEPASFEGFSTKERVLKELNMKKRRIDYESYDREVGEVFEWMLSKGDSENEYLMNLFVLAKERYVKLKYAGYVVSAVSSKRKEESKKKDREERNVSMYVGELGDRKEYELIYEREYGFETGYGVMFIHEMTDDEGNVFIWKTSKYLGLENGECFNIRGRIKEHKEYRGVRQTVLTRCTVL